MNRIRPHWPLAIALALFLLAFVVMYSLCVRRTNGSVVYILDDAYIHMAHAKNLTSHGSWGVSPEVFSSTASSSLWVLLVALFFAVIGHTELVSLSLNLVFSAAVIGLVYRLFRKSGFSGWPMLGSLLVVVSFSCLLQLSFTGLEHVAQIAISLAFASLAATILATPPGAKVSRVSLIGLLALAPLLTSIRYEGLFLVVIVAFGLLLRRRLRWGFALLALGSLPVLLVGTLALRHGWHFLPNSILLKANKPAPSLPGLAKYLLTDSYQHLIDLAPLSFLVAACLAIYLLRSRDKGVWERSQLMLGISVVTTFVHMQFSSLSWYLRYEAYLITLCLVSLMIALGESISELGGRAALWQSIVRYPPRAVAGVLLALFLVFPLANRSLLSAVSIPASAQNIFEQQYQMGLFSRRFYTARALAANDIGAICYLSEQPVVDIWGLATIEVCNARLQGMTRHPGAWPDIRFLNDLLRAKNVGVVMAYEKVVRRYGDPDSVGWVEVGSWTIGHNVICADDRIVFWAPDSLAADELMRNLAQYSEALPVTVEQEGRYLESKAALGLGSGRDADRPPKK